METKQEVVLKGKTMRMTWVRYIAQCLSRARVLSSDTQRSSDITILTREYVKKHGPSGSGVDCGTRLADSSHPQRIVLDVSFHHMDEHGSYDGWTEHKVIVTPEFDGVSVRVTGANRNGIKDYLGEMFQYWLTSEHDHPALIERAGQ